ncbi:hypothetical protein HZB90_00990 [archaeon]|nr:hypothetical protein [archaeon]
MAKKTNNLSEAKRQLDGFTSKCSKSKVLAHELGLAQSEEKMNQLLGETVLVAAKAHLDEAVNISGSDMKKAKAVALEAAEILRNHPIPQPFEAARASILNAVNEFVRKGITTVPPTPDAKGTSPTADAGAAGPADSDAVNRIVASAEKLLSQKKYAEARKVVAELVKLAKEQSDADLEKRAADLVEKIRNEQFKGLNARIDAWTKEERLLNEKQLEEFIANNKERAKDPIGALKEKAAEIPELCKKDADGFLRQAKANSYELEQVRKIILEYFSGLTEKILKRILNLPLEARNKISDKDKLPANPAEENVFFYRNLDYNLDEVKRFVVEWK